MPGFATRSSISADRRARTGWATSTSRRYILVYAGENGATRSANKKTRYNNFAPRLGVTYGLTDDMRTVLRTGFGITYFPSPYAAGNLNHLNVPFTISQNVSAPDQPARHEPGADDRQPVSCHRAGQAADDRGAQRREPAGDRPRLLERDRVRRAMAPRHRAAAVLDAAGRGRVRRQRRQAPHALLQPERDAARARARSQSRRLLQPVSNLSNMLQCDPRNRSTFHAGTLKVQQRFTNGLQFLVSYTYGKSLDYGGSAASGGGAVGNGQTVTNMDAWHGPSGYDVRHRAVISYVYQLPFGQGRRWMSDTGAIMRGHRRRLAAVGHHDDDDGTAVHGLPADTASTTARRAGPTVSVRARSTIRQWTCGSIRPTSWRRRPTPTATRDAGSCTRPGTSTSTRRCRSGSRSRARTNLEVRWDAFNLFNHPAFGFPNAEHRQPHRRAYHHDDCRQPEHAVRAEAQLLNRSATASSR